MANSEKLKWMLVNGATTAGMVICGIIFLFVAPLYLYVQGVVQLGEDKWMVAASIAGAYDILLIWIFSKGFSLLNNWLHNKFPDFAKPNTEKFNSTPAFKIFGLVGSLVSAALFFAVLGSKSSKHIATVGLAAMLFFVGFTASGKTNDGLKLILTYLILPIAIAVLVLYLQRYLGWLHTSGNW